MRSITYILSLVLIFIMPWEGILRFPGLGTGAKLFGIVVAVFWLATVITTGRLRKPRPFHLMVFLFVLWNAASVFWSASLIRSLSHLATWIQLLALVLILWDLYTTETELVAGLQAFVLGAYVAVGSAIYNFFRGNAFYTHYQRFSPDNTNPDGFGFILVLGMPLAWYLATTKSISSKSRFWTFINYAYIPLAFWGIALSGTRTALIASIVASLYGLIALSRIRPWIQAVLILVLIVTAIYSLPYLQTLKSFERLGTTGTELAEGTLNERTIIWRQGLASFVEHPLLGVGGNMFRSVNNIAKDNLGNVTGKVGHNTYLSVLVELGLIGFLLFGLILLTAFVHAWRFPRWESMFWLTVLAIWSIGAFALTWEPKKSTWLFLSFVIVNAALKEQRQRRIKTADLSTSPLIQATPTQKEFLPVNPGD